METALSSSSSTSSRQTNILIVDDHPFVRQGIAQYINQEQDMNVSAQASDGYEALDLLAKDAFDLVISDLEMEGLNGLSFMRSVKDQFPKLPVIVLSMHDEVQYGIRSLQAGAAGYVMKSESPEKLVEAIRVIRDGEFFFSKQVSHRWMSLIPIHGKKMPIVDNLSEREWEVYRLIGKGLPTREIAKELHIGRKTVETYKSRIKEKMGFERAPELTRHAIEWNRTNGAS